MRRSSNAAKFSWGSDCSGLRIPRADQYHSDACLPVDLDSGQETSLGRRGPPSSFAFSFENVVRETDLAKEVYGWRLPAARRNTAKLRRRSMPTIDIAFFTTGDLGTESTPDGDHRDRHPRISIELASGSTLTNRTPTTSQVWEARAMALATAGQVHGVKTSDDARGVLDALPARHDAARCFFRGARLSGWVHVLRGRTGPLVQAVSFSARKLTRFRLQARHQIATPGSSRRSRTGCLGKTTYTSCS